MQTHNLIDVMRGIRKHGIIDKMSTECFTFLIGIILEANEMGFKNPIELTVSQALCIGGGNSRQTLHGRRKSLTNFRLEGKALVIVKPGNKGRNSLATYQIDYDLLCSYNSVWRSDEAVPSRIIDNSPHSSPYSSLYSTPHNSPTILRSKDLRSEGDKIPPSPQLEVTTGNGQKIPNTGSAGAVGSTPQAQDHELGPEQIVAGLQERIHDKYRSQIDDAPEKSAVLDVLNEFGGDPKWLLAAIKAAPTLTHRTPISALNLIRSVALRLEMAGSRGGLTPSKRDELEREISEMEIERQRVVGLLENEPDKDRKGKAEFISQLDERLEIKRGILKDLS